MYKSIDSDPQEPVGWCPTLSPISCIPPSLKWRASMKPPRPLSRWHFVLHTCLHHSPAFMSPGFTCRLLYMRLRPCGHLRALGMQLGVVQSFAVGQWAASWHLHGEGKCGGRMWGTSLEPFMFTPSGHAMRALLTVFSVGLGPPCIALGVRTIRLPTRHILLLCVACDV